MGEYSGSTEAGGYFLRAFSNSGTGGTTQLPWPSGSGSSAVGINNSGQIALTGGAGNLGAYRYTPGVGYLSLGSLGGSQTEAAAINNSGQVTGFSESSDGRSHAYRYTDGAGLQDISAGYTDSVGNAINDNFGISDQRPRPNHWDGHS